MREFIDLVTADAPPSRRAGTRRLDEAPDQDGRKPRTRTRTRAPELSLWPELAAEPAAHAVPARRDAMPAEPPAPRTLGRQAGRTRTTRAAGQAGAAAQHPEFAGALGRLDMTDEIDDAEAARRAGYGEPDPLLAGPGVARLGGADAEPDAPLRLAGPAPTTDNLPALINRDLQLAGGRQRVDPEWHQVKHLPGYMQTAIRALARPVFRQFTDTPIEDIQMVCTILNGERDTRGVMAWIRQHGARDDSAAFDFGATIPGYTAEATLWRTKDFSFLLVRDLGGEYVYGWAGGRGVHLPATDTPRLGEAVMDKQAQGIDWHPFDPHDFPDYGQRLLLKHAGKIIKAACHGYDSGHNPEWYDWDGYRLHIGAPDAWAYPNGRTTKRTDSTADPASGNAANASSDAGRRSGGFVAPG